MIYQMSKGTYSHSLVTNLSLSYIQNACCAMNAPLLQFAFPLHRSPVNICPGGACSPWRFTSGKSILLAQHTSRAPSLSCGCNKGLRCKRICIHTFPFFLISKSSQVGPKSCPWTPPSPFCVVWLWVPHQP